MRHAEITAWHGNLVAVHKACSHQATAAYWTQLPLPLTSTICHDHNPGGFVQHAARIGVTNGGSQAPQPGVQPQLSGAHMQRPQVQPQQAASGGGLSRWQPAGAAAAGGWWVERRSVPGYRRADTAKPVCVQLLEHSQQYTMICC